MTLKRFNNGAHKKKVVLSLLDNKKFRTSEENLERLRKKGYEWRGCSTRTAGGCVKICRIKTEAGRIRSLGNYLLSLPEVEVKKRGSAGSLFRKKTS